MLLSDDGEAMSKTAVGQLHPDVSNPMLDTMTIFHWYAARTQPRHEKKVWKLLRFRDIEAFLPLYLSPRRWKNGVKVNLQLPLLPGYIFVKTSLRCRIPVLSVPGIVDLVGCGFRPTPIPDCDIEMLAHDVVQFKPEPYPYMKIGDRVRVRSGPLAGREGILVQKRDHLRFVLSMDLLMQSISVQLDSADLEHLPTTRRVS